MISIVCAAHRSQMYTRPHILIGPATSFATCESLRRQKEQRIGLPTMLHLRRDLMFPFRSLQALPARQQMLRGHANHRMPAVARAFELLARRARHRPPIRVRLRPLQLTRA
jgi:hypothetical protein